MTVGLAVAAIVLLLAAVLSWRVVTYYRRADFIRTYRFLKGLVDKLAARRPELARQDIALVARGGWCGASDTCLVFDQRASYRLALFIRRCFSRVHSRFFSVSRLSAFCLPRPRPKASLMRPPL